MAEQRVNEFRRRTGNLADRQGDGGGKLRMQGTVEGLISVRWVSGREESGNDKEVIAVLCFSKSMKDTDERAHGS